MTPLDRSSDPDENRSDPKVVKVNTTAGDVLWQTFSVPFSYPVCFTRDVFDGSNRGLVDSLIRLERDRRHRLVVAIDSGVAESWPDLGNRIGAYAEAHAEHLELAGDPVIVPGGERAKDDGWVLKLVLDAIHGAGLDRQSFVVAIGGGAMLDVAGYAAATAHRGVRLIRLPTTVLAQNDAGIGVKNAINT